MGAQQFSELAIVRKNGDSKAAFDQAYDSARHYYGHRPYTGSICEKMSVRDVPCGKGCNPYKLVRKTLDDRKHWVDDKDSPCAAVEITGVFLKRLKEKRGLKGRKNLRAFILFGWASS